MKKYIVVIALSALSNCFGMESNDHCDITGLKKAAVLQALLQNAQPNDRYEQVTPQFPQKSCKKMISERPDQYVGTVDSRAVHIHFDKDVIDVRSYNKNNGAGAAQKAIAGLKPQSKL